MGEVYRARDTRLDRTVAIKVLPEALAADPQLRERFDREARAISSLNHPHICALYDVGHHPSTGSGQGLDFLVLEYLEGQTLAERLASGAGAGPHGTALPPQDALKIAIEICDALDKAHRSGIVHRDLKPANVMLTKAGAKLLDFGLARSAAPVVSTTGLSMLPTTPPNLTAQGAILGTFQYMAPEQIEGLEADARTDIFAFGALLFEMLTGRPAFEGKTRASLLGAILKDEPPRVSALRPLAPAALDRIVGTCLAKDQDDRYQSARDLLRDLKWVASGSSEVAGTPAATAPPRSNKVAWWVAAVATVAAIATAGWAFRRPYAAPPPADAVQFTINAPDNMAFGGPSAGGTGTATQIAVSPDGRHIVFVAGAGEQYQIWLRAVGAVTAQPIPGTEEGAFPFWSPDSRSIAFFASGKLKKVQIGGGPPIALCDAPAARGGTWSRNNVIVFAPSIGGLMRVPGAGGTPTAITALDPSTGETNHRWPSFLPDGRHFLYTATIGTCCPASKPATVRVGSIDRDEPAVSLFQAESSVRFSAGHLLFARDDRLMAQPFDPQQRKLTGDAFPLVERVSNEGSRYAGFSVSEASMLVFGTGARESQRLVWLDRTGKATGTLSVAAPYFSLALSPDEKQVAVVLTSGSPENRDVYIVDVARDQSMRLTTDPGFDFSPVWSPDGLRIAFEGRRAGKVFIRQKQVLGTAPDEPLLPAADLPFVGASPTSWSSDGRFIAYTQGAGTSGDVWVVPVGGNRQAFPIAQTAAMETSGMFSPDGRWLAYTSDDGGRREIYVQPFPADGRRYKVSRNGGSHPVWRGDGKELFYLREPDGMLIAVPIPTGTPGWNPGAEQELFNPGAIRLNPSQQYAPTRDGKRFLVNRRPQRANAEPLTVILNWPATLQK